MSNHKNCKVVVSMVTCNHEKFIDKAILGALNQETNFDFMIVLSNDSSSDRSHEICKDFVANYPDKILYKEFQSNVGMVGNWNWNLEKCFEFHPEYIAICEGDDIWIDPYKLQKQVEILDKNPEHSMVCGDVNIIDEEGTFVRRRFSFEKDFNIDSTYLVKKNHITTCTVLIRKGFIDLSILTPEINFLDKFLWLTMLSNGSCYFLNDILSSYRIHSGGTYSKLREYQKSLKRLEDYSKMKRIFPYLKPMLSKQMKSNIKMGILSSIKHGQFKSLAKIIAFLFQ